MHEERSLVRKGETRDGRSDCTGQAGLNNSIDKMAKTTLNRSSDDLDGECCRDRIARFEA